MTNDKVPRQAKRGRGSDASQRSRPGSSPVQTPNRVGVATIIPAVITGIITALWAVAALVNWHQTESIANIELWGALTGIFVLNIVRDRSGSERFQLASAVRMLQSNADRRYAILMLLFYFIGAFAFIRVINIWTH